MGINLKRAKHAGEILVSDVESAPDSKTVAVRFNLRVNWMHPL